MTLFGLFERSTLKRINSCLLFWISGAWLLTLFACNSPDRVLEIPAVQKSGPKSIDKIADYPEALAAIVPAMVHALKLPAPEGKVFFYRDAGAYQSALTKELKAALEDWVRDKIDPETLKRNRHETAFELFKFTYKKALQTGATTFHQKVLVAEWVMMKLPWRDRVRILAHELTHTIQIRLAKGKVNFMDRWLLEGFAEWISFKVVDALAFKNYFDDQIRRSRSWGVPTLRELSLAQDWERQMTKIGSQAAYGQAALATDYLVARKGIPSIIEYFRLFDGNQNADQNFAMAFGEPVAAFQEELREQLNKSTPNVASVFTPAPALILNEY